MEPIGPLAVNRLQEHQAASSSGYILVPGSQITPDSVVLYGGVSITLSMRRRAPPGPPARPQQLSGLLVRPGRRRWFRWWLRLNRTLQAAQGFRMSLAADGGGRSTAPRAA